MVVFTHVSTFPNRKVKSGVGKIAEEELGSTSRKLVVLLYHKNQNTGDQTSS